MMNHEQIKKELHAKGLTFAALAKATGRQAQNMSGCSSRRGKSKPCALIISAALGKPVSEVFSDIEEYLEPDTQAKNKDRVNRTKKLLEDAGLENLVA